MPNSPLERALERALEPGSKAPKFDLESDSGERRKLGDYAGKWLVLYFYPKDSTPGCTREAQDFTGKDTLARLKKLGAEVAGVSKDSIKSHCTFRDKFAIKFPLLSDPDLTVHKAYGAFGEKTMYGKKVEGVIRSTFLVGPDGKIAKVWRSVKVDGHVAKVLEALQEAQAGSAGKDGQEGKSGKSGKTAKKAKSA
jgi:peroxiredoxin Q/BCP